MKPDIQSMGIEFDLSRKTCHPFALEDFEHTQKEKTVYWLHCDLSQPEIFQKLSEKLHLSTKILQLIKDNETFSKIVDTLDSLALRLECVIPVEVQGKSQAQFGTLIIF